jgi:hypothetical protein
MSKRDIEIRITRDSRFNVAGLTVDTLDEAFDRYDKKMKREPSGSNWYFLTGVTTMFVSNKKAKEDNEEVLADFGLPGDRQFVTTCVKDILRIKKRTRIGSETLKTLDTKLML